MSSPPDLIPVRPAHRFDEQRLAAYLHARLPGFAGSVRIRQFHGGQSNPTYLVEGGGPALVLRKKPPGQLLPSAHMIEREFRILRALADTDVPVPVVHFLCADSAVIGTPFYVMDYVPGRVMHPPALPGLPAAERSAVYDAMNDVLARLHRVDWQRLGLADFGRGGGYIARQIARWSRQYEATRTREIAAMTGLMKWLPEHIPAGDETSVVHGDFRLQNLLFHPDEPRIVAVLDWELATLGHPLSDLAYNCMIWHFPAASEAFPGIGGIEQAGSGIPAENDYVAAYCRRTGRASIPHWNFYMAFSLFRMAAILQGVYARALQGNASSENAIRMEPMVSLLADIGWRLVEGR